MRFRGFLNPLRRRTRARRIKRKTKQKIRGPSTDNLDVFLVLSAVMESAAIAEEANRGENLLKRHASASDIKR